jgi:hypothetical protein
MLGQLLSRETADVSPFVQEFDERSLAVEANRRKTELYQPKAAPKLKTVPVK